MTALIILISVFTGLYIAGAIIDRADKNRRGR